MYAESNYAESNYILAERLLVGALQVVIYVILIFRTTWLCTYFVRGLFTDVHEQC
jgi:hypothetical protein